MLFRPSSLRNREASRCFAKFGLPVVNFVPPWGPLDPENAPTSFEFIKFRICSLQYIRPGPINIIRENKPFGGTSIGNIAK